MTIAILVLAAVAAAAAIASYVEQRSARAPEGMVGQAVRVSTRGSTVVQGVVHADVSDWLTLRDAVVEVIGTDAEAPAGGLVHIPRAHIDIVQQLPRPTARAEA